MTDQSNTQAAPYGYCPECGEPGVTRERRPDGDDKCVNGHRYQSRNAHNAQPTPEPLPDHADHVPEIAARPEPTFAGIAGRKLDDLKAQGYVVDGYSIQHAETKQRGFITTGGFVGWWINTDHVQPGTEPVAQADEMDKLTLTITFDDDVDCSIEVFGTTKHLTRLKTWLERCDLANEAIAARASLPAGGEPVAAIGSGWTFLWASRNTDTIEDIVKRHGLKIGSKLYATPQPSETQGRRQMTDEMLKVLKGCRDTAMAKAASARVPECGDFGGIAQDLDWLVAELCPASPQDGGEKA